MNWLMMVPATSPISGPGIRLEIARQAKATMTTVAAMVTVCQSGTCHCELTNPAMLPVSRSYPRIFGNLGHQRATGATRWDLRLAIYLLSRRHRITHANVTDSHEVLVLAAAAPTTATPMTRG